VDRRGREGEATYTTGLFDRAAQRLEGVGFSLTDDGGRVRLFALPCAEAAVRTLSDVEEVVTPSAEQLEVLAMSPTSARPPAR
jgi:hypothetical protein